MILLIVQCVWNLTKDIWYFCLLFHILPLRLLSGVLSRYEKWGILASHILLSQRPDLKEMQVIHFDQDVQVCGIFHEVLILNIFGTPLNHESLSFERMPFIWKYGLSLFLSFFFSFLHALWHFFLSCLLAWVFSFFF